MKNLSYPFGISVIIIFLSLLSCKEHSKMRVDPENTQEGDDNSGTIDDDPVRVKTYVPYNNITATNGLGRELPAYDDVGPTKEDKYVGLFYWTWHTQQSDYGRKNAYNVSMILKLHPDAINDYYDPAWPDDATSFFWGEPLFGYYLDTDGWVLRKHAELLAIAGVDVIIFDCTNGSFTWQESYLKLCKVFEQARRDGVKTPQIAFMLAFGPTEGSKAAITRLYENFYLPGKYEDLVFKWKGKPLILAYPDNLSPEIRNYFTFRPMQPAYNIGPERNDQWGWLEIYPQHTFPQGGLEEMPVGVAQNWSKKRGLTAMNAPNTFGRSYSNERGQAVGDDAVNYGYNFQEQWDRALQIDPNFVFVTGWNEWIAGRYKEWQGQYNAFPDEFSQEKSRDIEPMKGGHGDNYYYQLASNIRRFKGTRQIILASKPKTISVKGRLDEWDSVKPVYRTPRGNTRWRNHVGWGGVNYVNETGRNDFVEAKVARDDSNIYFYIKLDSSFTQSEDRNWIWLFLDWDRDVETGWEGYDYIVDRQKTVSNKMTVEKNVNGWNWEKIGEATFNISAKVMEIAIPRSLLGENNDLDFEFKLADNLRNPGKIMDFYLSGDVAPVGRFNWIYKTK